MKPPAQFVIAVGSGKGGVGKSTVALNLALALARERPVGLLDADLYGPDIPRMVGLARTHWTRSWTLASATSAQRFEPVERFGLVLASAGFILGEDQPMGLGASAADLLLHQLLYQVEWGELEYLVIDLPPGTADVLATILRRAQVSGAVVVVTPQDVAHLDARKAVQKFRHAGVPILGGVENMSAFRCPHCGNAIALFPEVREARSIWSMGVDRLGAIPVDPAISAAAESGTPLVVREPNGPAAVAYRDIAALVTRKLHA